MKLIIAIVQDEDAARLVSNLMNEGYSVTKLATTGGFLRGGNTTLMIGVEEENLELALSDIREKSSRRHTVTVPAAGIPHAVDSASIPLKVVVGGATVFILNVEDFKKF